MRVEFTRLNLFSNLHPKMDCNDTLWYIHIISRGNKTYILCASRWEVLVKNKWVKRQIKTSEKWFYFTSSFLHFNSFLEFERTLFLIQCWCFSEWLPILFFSLIQISHTSCSFVVLLRCYRIFIEIQLSSKPTNVCTGRTNLKAPVHWCIWFGFNFCNYHSFE